MDAELRDAVLKVARELKGPLYDYATSPPPFKPAAMYEVGHQFMILMGQANREAKAEKEEEKSMNTPQTELLETTAITADIDFDEWMACACANAKAKFVRKRKEGYTGWTDPALWDVFMKGIHKNLAQVESPDTDASQKADALIDIINFAVMAWRTTKKEAAQ